MHACLQAIVKTRDIWIRIQGIIPEALLALLREEYGRRLILRSEWGERLRNVLDAPLYELDPRETSPGVWLRFLRREQALSQAELGKMIGGASRQNVCDMESGRRQIGRLMALRLARLFEVSPDKFI